jgi:hypothetical protein
MLPRSRAVERCPDGGARTRSETDRNDPAPGLLSLVRTPIFQFDPAVGHLQNDHEPDEDPFPQLAMPGIACPTCTYHMKEGDG